MNFQSDAFRQQQAIQARCFHPGGEWKEFPQSALAGSIVARFEAMVTRYPDRLAVKAGEEALTYVELNAAANQLAYAILAARGEGAEPVAFLLEQGVQAIVGMLGSLKAGKFYLALDPTHPSARSQTSLTDTQASLLITNHANLVLAAQTASRAQQILKLDKLAHDLAPANPQITMMVDAIAYLVYTSDTTSTPKGVIETHRHVLHYTRVFTKLYHRCQYDRLAATGSNSSCVLCPSLTAGVLLWMCPMLPHARYLRKRS